MESSACFIARTASAVPLVILVYLSLFLYTALARADLFRCQQPDKTIELTDSGCGQGKVEEQYSYSPVPTQETSPAIAPGTIVSPNAPDLNAAARKLGFRDMSHFESSLSYCMDLYRTQVSNQMNVNCGSDLQCLQREGKLMMDRSNRLMQSSQWKSYKCDVAIQAANYGSGQGRTYEIEFSHNDELFIIYGEKFKAKTYCFGWNEGDEAVFADGSPNGACASAILVNLRNKNTCDVWCE